MNNNELYAEVVSFLGTCLLGEGDPQPMTAEDAAYTMSNWAAEDIECPEGMTPDLMASTWNRLITHESKKEDTTMEKNLRTYAIGNGEITLTEHDAEELRVMLQTDHLQKTVAKLIHDNRSELYFNGPSALKRFTDEIVEMNDDLINYDSSYFTEMLTENIFNRAATYNFLKR